MNVTTASPIVTKATRDISCLQERYWPKYVISIVATFFGGLILILLEQGINHCAAWIRRRRRINQFNNQTDWRVSGGSVVGGSGTPAGKYEGSSIFLNVPASNSQLSDVEGDKDGRQNRCQMIGVKIENGRLNISILINSSIN